MGGIKVPENHHADDEWEGCTVEPPSPWTNLFQVLMWLKGMDFVFFVFFFMGFTVFLRETRFLHWPPRLPIAGEIFLFCCCVLLQTQIETNNFPRQI